LEPFIHAQRIPGEAFRAAPMIWLLLIDVVMLAAGLLAFHRRDLR
jgi:ABC-2 type transport system permease protein